MNTKDFYSIPEMAKILRISRIAVYKKVKNGQIKATKIGRNFAISKDELEVILGESLNPNQKRTIDEGVKKTVKEYGDVLQMLGNV
ncbi:MAG: binding domain protein, excisionase family protein [Candidatus Roizmanbacteria bacterium GW2011_GWC2_37_13]|uniref:Binding domain protein, excisionase family protein n=1 Tax=Candidatus Roizmanbacteria bacterium GW2011_GWC2_37_13 TaxID=1618486 RepID=A0A0G0G400_9BACT|nr:MAG: binding domain protein, excisionase family protein [Candidatus Roizmanbacteria bacterium GW2011_GWC1_37_12]KKQ25848.1 MAG: binding domain protein, excisionase family protein [Candidatus Roizmanbacteria bacterium GW2011_GWC2_37_13]